MIFGIGGTWSLIGGWLVGWCVAYLGLTWIRHLSSADPHHCFPTQPMPGWPMCIPTFMSKLDPAMYNWALQYCGFHHFIFGKVLKIFTGSPCWPMPGMQANMHSNFYVKSGQIFHHDMRCVSAHFRYGEKRTNNEKGKTTNIGKISSAKALKNFLWAKSLHFATAHISPALCTLCWVGGEEVISI